MFLTEGSLVICNHYKTCKYSSCMIKIPYKCIFTVTNPIDTCLENRIPIKIIFITEFQYKMYKASLKKEKRNE